MRQARTVQAAISLPPPHTGPDAGAWFTQATAFFFAAFNPAQSQAAEPVHSPAAAVLVQQQTAVQDAQDDDVDDTSFFDLAA